MRRATQEDIDNFFAWAKDDPEIFPYLSVSKYIHRRVVSEDEWKDLFFISDCGKCYLHIGFDRVTDTEFSISLYSKSPILAGRAVIKVKEMIQRYKPRAIHSVVHGSNTKSLKLHRKIFGEPWGIEPSTAWNMGAGAYDDLHHFRMIL